MMPSISAYFALLPFFVTALSSPLKHGSPLSNPDHGPIPGESPLYSNYRGKGAPFPALHTKPIMPTENEPPGPDDLLFQNLLSAEWIIYSFYQYGVDTFNASSFAALGLPNTTYDRLQEIRDNEAGHLRIFQDQITNTSVKPGPCEYNFGIKSAAEYVGAVVTIETGSMIFVTGLAAGAKLPASVAAIAAIGETESRHNTWSLIDLFGANPFSGPVDTVYPYPNQILDITAALIIPGSCPKANPVYPSPPQNLPPIALTKTTKSVAPGSHVQLAFTQADNQPSFRRGRSYYAVFNHAVENITVPFDTTTNKTVIPAAFEANKGAIVMVIADEPGAPTLESCVAGPVIIMEQPVILQP